MNVWEILTTIVTVSSVVLVGLNWFRGVLTVWIPPQSRFWGFYAKVEQTVEYISISRSAFGKSGTLPAALGAAPVDGEAERRKAEAARI